MPLLIMGRPRRWSSARTLGVAVAAALVVSLCLLVGSRRMATGPETMSGGGALASDLGRRTMAAAAGAHPGGQVLLTETEVPVQELLVVYGGRRRLLSGGPGSHPPRCTSKCGSCSPCYPVHVSVPPGVLVTTEYYPEAWRCKCRDQLYMP
ncbi:hypothetical protein U9M48_044314 [Paspalum notatum var. saurae]|uniref:Epidermal patterning factor-like protein n=1 Tax=Paspalum notatum var. saurae TaxID=547442 RepID=A0AAQ3UWJ6_PASNO